MSPHIMIDHLTHLTYNIDFQIAHFNLLQLPCELILLVISYLDYPELINLSRADKFLHTLITHYRTYIQSVRFHRVKIRLARFLPQRPTVSDLYYRRVLKYRFIRILIQPYIWNRLEMFELLTFMAKKRSLEKALSQRPKKADLIARGILKPLEYSSVDDLDAEFLDNMTKPVVTNKIANKIKTLENYKIEEVLRNFLKRYQRSQKYGGCDGHFMSKLSFFENFTSAKEDAVHSITDKKRKRILTAQVVGNKVIFV